MKAKLLFTPLVRHFVILSISVMVLFVSASAFAVAPCVGSQQLGLIGYAESVGKFALGIDVQGNYAYVGDWNQGYYHQYAGVFQVFDVTDPCNPTRLPGAVETTSPGYNEIGDVAVYGTRAYVANDANGFAVYDITDPTHPVLLSQLPRSDGSFAFTVFYKGGQYAYVGYGHSPVVAIYDVSTLPLSPPVLYSTGAQPAFDIFVAGNRMYVNAESGLYIVDVTNPLSPQPIGSVALPPDQYGQGGEVRVQGHYAYLALSDNIHPGGLRVVDISDETHPTLVASFDIPGGTGGAYARGIGLAVEGTSAYVAARGGLWVFDVSVPSIPKLVHNFPPPSTWNSIGVHVEVRNNLAYMTAYPADDQPFTGGLAIYKIAEGPTYTCTGFEPPIGDTPVSVKKSRALPFKAQLTDSQGAAVTDLGTSPPVIQVIYAPEGSSAVDITAEAVPVGLSTQGNQFAYTEGKWQFNLDTRPYAAPGTYTVSMVPGNSYVILPTCTGSFVIK